MRLLKMSKGFMMFAHNNDEIDYPKLAVVNAMLIKQNCDIHDITVVTNRYAMIIHPKILK